ncbi:hypothetical protein DAPPUDRAFT_310712 [Daphnia pulex]|uniref:BRCT domain-containing protein n=1 Tax=Daphnia pulex TaxID=6669 RepID=E9FV92_DAPPU|nr:hypothetical protein DAPPUDRAFT_310712 [Daphnia pulex]|eukprot:EFX89148.1 hypothetical protein DAPPUDRAFT_310712 [Daphnia pulex]
MEVLSDSITSEIDETNVNASTPPIQKQSVTCQSEECLDLVLSLKAGRFLEGFKIFLIGFDGPQMEKLQRVLKNAGVIHLSTINDESISHVIVGNIGKEDEKQLQQLTRKPHVVTVESRMVDTKSATESPSSRSRVSTSLLQEPLHS